MTTRFQPSESLSLQEVLIWCSGANTKVLHSQRCFADRNKYAMIGAFVGFTGSMAFLSMSYALFTIFQSYLISMSLGLVWGGFIFILDRFLISTTRKPRQFSWNQLWMIMIRLGLALAVAVVVATPLELRIFQGPISNEIAKHNNAIASEVKNDVTQRYKPQIQKLETQKQQLQTEVEQRQQQRYQAYKATIGEAEGIDGTKQEGRGPVYQEKQAELAKQEKDLLQVKQLNQEKISQLETDIRKLEQERDSRIAKAEDGERKGGDLMTQLSVLHELEQKDEVLKRAGQGISLLFIFADVVPILAKLLAHRSAYDAILERQENAVVNLEDRRDDDNREILYQVSQAKMNQIPSILEKIFSPRKWAFREDSLSNELGSQVSQDLAHQFRDTSTAQSSQRTRRSKRRQNFQAKKSSQKTQNQPAKDTDRSA